ncbi:ABC transporter transmembrane domain-containing protein [Nocardiopsis baichengensis]|uniref:ABC transporter transmembrane domain-containing protein n=1 Tax=Nocardiopsis baichengensis TaxID=280240 RepID=UPI000349C27E|nr:ABC transporter ATP-binding protein [Nocardiopsis baichengensis]
MSDTPLRRAVRRNRGAIARSVLGQSLYQVCETLVPVAIGVVIDRAVAAGDPAALAVSLAGLAALFTVLTLSWRYGARAVVRAGEHEAHRLRVEVAGHALDPRSPDTGMGAGELLTVATTDADRTAQVLHPLTGGAGSLVGLAVAAAVLLGIDPLLGGGVLVGVPVLVAIVQGIGPVLTRRTADQQEALARAGGLAADLVRGLPALRGIGAEEHAARRYASSSAAALRGALRAAVPLGLYQGATGLAGGLLLAAVAAAAGTAAVQGRISVGELVTVVGLAQFLTEPVREIGYATMHLARSKASSDRLERVLRAPFRLAAGEPGADGRTGAPGAAPVELKGVGGALGGLDLRVAPGEFLGVVCYDPADARALVDVLAARSPAAEHGGAYLVDGVPAEALGPERVRERVLVEPHDADLFEGTLAENVLTGAAPGADPWPALRAAAADEVVRTVPGGLQAPLTDRGTTLSGGQRQRLGLARALAADPPVLVLHDPTTAVDAVTEEAIAAGLRRLRHGACTVAVCSSPALLARADRVVAVAGGRVAAEGTHAGLAADDPDYAEAVLR